MTFAHWPEDVHESPDQLKRLASAKSAKTTPTSIDTALHKGIFPGSGATPYSTTLESCTCVDFNRRKLPCKHIYRLAIELGLLEEEAESGVNKNTLLASQISLEKAVSILEGLSEEAQHIIIGFIYQNIYREKVEIPIAAYDASDELLNCELVESIDAPNIALQAFKKAEIIEILDVHSITGFRKTLNRKYLISWCVGNIPDLWSIFPKCHVFRLSEQFQSARRRTYTYLLRKFEWDFFLDGVDGDLKEIKYPHGAKFEGSAICYFPDDKVTQLLTKYGHNRCLHGFDISSQYG